MCTQQRSNLKPRADPRISPGRGSSGLPCIPFRAWNVQRFRRKFRARQLLMRDPMHQIDLGAIVAVHLIIQAIFARVSRVCRDGIGPVRPRRETTRNVNGWDTRFRLTLAKRIGNKGQRCALSNMSDYL